MMMMTAVAHPSHFEIPETPPGEWSCQPRWRGRQTAMFLWGWKSAVYRKLRLVVTWKWCHSKVYRMRQLRSPSRSPQLGLGRWSSGDTSRWCSTAVLFSEGARPHSSILLHSRTSTTLIGIGRAGVTFGSHLCIIHSSKGSKMFFLPEGCTIDIADLWYCPRPTQTFVPL